MHYHTIISFCLLTLIFSNVSAETFIIDVTPVVPTDIPGGAVDADVDDAANFAWEQFIALNWPADTSGGQRDVADETATFGDPAYDGPLVWHTFRHKSEIFPGSGAPAGYDDTAPDFGYSTLPPVYTYGPDIGENGIVPACPPQPPVDPMDTALINLDETSQIGLDYMFAGVAPTSGDISNGINSVPQLIRFLAQGNKTYYKYIADPDALVTDGDPLYTHPKCPLSPTGDVPDPYDHTYCVAKRNFKAVSKGNGTTTTLPGITVNFPAGTILAKGGFRELTDDEANSGRFYTTTVRYYEDDEDNEIGGTTGELCYMEATWGLVSLHIIHKTPTAPSFVYSTFEQVDNLMTQDGIPVEGEDGKVEDDGGEDISTTPALIYEDDPPTLTIDGDDIEANYCQNTGSRLYYLENEEKAALPHAGFICQNFRNHSTPAHIRRANRAAQNAIQLYAKKNGIKDSPFMYYRLIHVQAEPFDKTEISTNQLHKNRAPSIFYLSNILLETDYTLQNFSGRLTFGDAGGLTSDFEPNFTDFNGSESYQNVLTFDGDELQSTANMGGCMGCHGVAQGGGNDFSFVLVRGRVAEPEAPEITPPGTSNQALNLP
jgi:hypothetical protein